VTYAQALQLAESLTIKRAWQQYGHLTGAQIQEALDRGKYEDIKGWWRLGVASPEDATRAQTVAELWAMQDAAWKKWHEDPHVKSEVENVSHYTIGRGVMISSSVREVDDVLRECWTRNRMNMRHKDMVESAYVEGEYYLAYFVQGDGRVTLRDIPPKEIPEIETHPEDAETRLAYRRQFARRMERLDRYYADIEYYARLANDPENGDLRSTQHEELEGRIDDTSGTIFIQQIKLGPDKEVRGRVPLAASLKFFKLAEECVIDAQRRWHEQSKVIWFQKIVGRLDETTQRERRSPPGGIMLRESENVTYRSESPNMAAADGEIVRKACLYTAGAGVGTPLHILDQNAENEVYASIRKADTPYSQKILSYQDFWDDAFREMCRVILRAAVWGKRLPEQITITRYTQEALWEAIDMVITGLLAHERLETIIEAVRPVLTESEHTVTIPTEDAPLDIVFPVMIHESPLEQAQALVIWQQLGVSQRTLLTKLGLDWQEELAHRKMLRQLLRQEHADDLKVMQSTPMPPSYTLGEGLWIGEAGDGVSWRQQSRSVRERAYQDLVEGIGDFTAAQMERLQQWLQL
jgi:hypothetical protein